MKVLGLVMMGLLIVYAFFGLQGVRADEADEAYKTGLKYYNGEGVSQNYAEALQWYWKAADQGNAKAQLNMGLMYANGQGVSQNHTEALRWFRKAADQGNADAQLNIRSMYANGEGITQNYRETVKWNYNPSVPVGQNLRSKAVGCPGGSNMGPGTWRRESPTDNGRRRDRHFWAKRSCGFSVTAPAIFLEYR